MFPNQISKHPIKPINMNYSPIIKISTINKTIIYKNIKVNTIGFF